MEKQSIWDKIANSLSILSSVVDIWNILSYLLSIIAGGSSVITALNNLPAYIYLTLGAISIASLLFSIVRTVVRYRRWVKIINDPTMQNILKTLQSLHLHLGSLTNNLRGLYVSNQQLLRCANALQKLIGIDSKFFDRLEHHSFDSIWQSVYRRTKKVYGFNLKEIISLTNSFVDTGKEMDKAGFGISKLKKDSQYQNLYTQLKHYELELNLSDASKIYTVDQVLDLSFGLQSLSLLWIYLKRASNFINKIPPNYVYVMEKSSQKTDSVYSVALLQLKQIIMDDLIRSKL